MTPSPAIVRCDQPHAPAAVGAKAHALYQLREAGLPIPPWLVVSPDALLDGQLSPDTRSALAEAMHTLGLSGKPLAVRSSSTEEDSAAASFAGQFESFLGIGEPELEATIAKVWQSGYAERVAAYKTSRGESSPAKPPAIIVQALVAADAAGVAFSVNPIDANWEHALVSAVPGLGSALVDGESDADTFTIDRSGNSVSTIAAHKSHARFLVSKNGYSVESAPLPPETANALCLSPEQAAAVATLARRCEAHFGRPQDIEWAIESGNLFLLQSRPITTLHHVPFAGGKLYLWDNSNIAESYSGVTLPLTFSFARYIYTEVYQQFCRMLQVAPARVARHRVVFGQMLGLVRGRVYYNLLSWYKVLALLPGYELNRSFMEQMMGVKEPLPPDAQAEVDTFRRSGKLADALNLVRSLAGLVYKHWTIERDVARFYQRFETALAQASKPLDSMRLEELADHFHELERDLLGSWDAPLVNDFLAMIFFGLLRKQCGRSLGPEGETRCNDLLCGIGGLISAEPAARMRQMAELVAPDPALAETLRRASRARIEQALALHPRIQKEIDSYLAKFGDRCLDELKLESAALSDDPLPLYRSIGELASHNLAQRAPYDFAAAQSGAESALMLALRRKPLRRVLTRWILKHARRRVGCRENLRFERTRLFGRIRRIFLEAGKRLHAFNVLDDPRDVFYLEVYEIIGYIEGIASTTDLRGLVHLRRRQYESYQTQPSPDDRFQTRGPVPIGNTFQSARPASASAGPGDTLQGIGCCPGIVRGLARVVTHPHDAALQQGEILVAKQTDPGWIMLFPLASGLLVERGSLLSHSAIVSRELGLPAVVSIRDLLDSIRTGDLVELDGSTGLVQILTRATAQP